MTAYHTTGWQTTTHGVQQSCSSIHTVLFNHLFYTYSMALQAKHTQGPIQHQTQNLQTLTQTFKSVMKVPQSHTVRASGGAS